MTDEMRYHGVLGTVCVGLVAWCGEVTGDRGPTHQAYCHSYCSSKGVLRPAKTCYSFTERPIYCCGSRNYRYCCDNKYMEVSHAFGPVTSCPNYNSWYYQWRTIVGLLTSLLLLIVLSACCYQCCGGKTGAVARTLSRRWRQRSSSDTRGSDIPIPTITPNRTNGPRENIGDFNPASPNAFQPPPYESLPKDPPKYCDIFGTAQAQDNRAFTNDADGLGNGGVHQASGLNVTEINDPSGATRGQDGNQPSGATRPTAVSSTQNSRGAGNPVYENVQLNVPNA